MTDIEQALTETCKAHVWRGDIWHPRREMCGKPAKGTRHMDRGGIGGLFPACGIHMRMKSTPLYWGDHD